MKVTYILILFIMVVIAQVFIPVKMIWYSQEALEHGVAYKFRTQPIDPTDPFRGKYITLRYDIDHFYTPDSTFVVGEEIYVYLKRDKEGFAEVTEVSKQPLELANDFVTARVTYFYNGKVNFQLPFYRFYMEESKAYDAELAYRKVNRDTMVDNVYALVYVKGQDAVLKNVYINNIPIQEYVENEKK